MRIRQNADGYGTSGCCASEFSVTIPTADYVKQLIPPSAPIVLYMGENYTFSPTFYISSRSKRGNTVTFKCYDRMMFTDQTIVLSDGSYENDSISSTVMSVISRQCGFERWGVGGTSTNVPEINIPRNYVEGRSCRTILNTLSAAWCGYFKVSDDDALLFIPFGSIYSLGNEAQKHTAIIEKSEKGPIEQVIMSSGTDTFYAGNTSADVFGTLKISSELASQELAGYILSRIRGYIYQAWECSKAIIDFGFGNIETDAEIQFEDGSVRIANYIEKIPTSSGVFIVCGRNEVSENEFNYTGTLTRAINQKIGDGEVLGNNTMLTRYQGIIHLGEKSKARNGSSEQKRFGYSPATENGIVEFDGVMVSKVTPTSATINADKTEAVVNYEGKSYKYLIERDSSGNITSFGKEEVT